MTTDPRIPPIARNEMSDDAVAALGVLAQGDTVDNVFATFAQHPDLFRRYLPFGNHVLFKATIGKRETELAILRIGSLNRAEYEFAQHTALGSRPRSHCRRNCPDTRGSGCRRMEPARPRHLAGRR